MVGLIEGEDTGPKLLGCLHSPKHGVEDLIVKGLPYVEFDDLFGLGHSYFLQKMVQLLIVYDIGFFMRHVSIFLHDQIHEIVISLHKLALLHVLGSVEVRPVQGRVCLVLS